MASFSAISSRAFDREHRFVGRDRELAVMQARWEDALVGRGGAVMLLGEAGVGKTHLATMFAKSARERRARVLWGCCDEGEPQPPYRPWLQALSELEVEAGSAGPLEIGRAAPPLLTKLLDIGGTPDHNAQRFRFYDGVTQLLLRLAATSPVLLVLDDLHCADSDSVRLLGHLARFLDHSCILIVGTMRPDELMLIPQHPLNDLLIALPKHVRYQEIAVEGLSLGETGASSSSRCLLP